MLSVTIMVIKSLPSQTIFKSGSLASYLRKRKKMGRGSRAKLVSTWPVEEMVMNED